MIAKRERTPSTAQEDNDQTQHPANNGNNEYTMNQQQQNHRVKRTTFEATGGSVCVCVWEGGGGKYIY